MYRLRRRTFIAAALTLAAGAALPSRQLLAKTGTPYGTGPVKGAQSVGESIKPFIYHRQTVDPYAVGLNFNFGENFADGPDGNKYRFGYTYPDDPVVLQQFYDLGIRVVQLPFKIERVLPDPNGGINLEEVGRIKDFVAAAWKVGIQTYPSPHNFGRYWQVENIIGTPAYPYEVFAKFWGLFAQEFKDTPGIWAYSLDTEPFNMGNSQREQLASQAAVNAIRQVDTQTLISVPGADHWSSSLEWLTYSKDLHIIDPADHVVYECTCYGDDDFSGQYKRSYQQMHTDPDTMVRNVMPFVSWLDQHGYRGIVTEWGVPTNDPQWLEVADRFLAFLKERKIGSFAWAWGPWWPADYPLYISPDGQMAQLLGSYATQ